MSGSVAPCGPRGGQGIRVVPVRDILIREHRRGAATAPAQLRSVAYQSRQQRQLSGEDGDEYGTATVGDGEQWCPQVVFGRGRLCAVMGAAAQVRASVAHRGGSPEGPSRSSDRTAGVKGQRTTVRIRGDGRAGAGAYLSSDKPASRGWTGCGVSAASTPAPTTTNGRGSLTNDLRHADAAGIEAEGWWCPCASPPPRSRESSKSLARLSIRESPIFRYCLRALSR